jgi:histidine triad (HIT) family protein
LQDCIFCKIASGDIESEVVEQTEAVVAFRDINPAAPTHVLVIPRRHIASAADLGRSDAALLAEMFEVAAALAAQEGLEAGYRVVTNVGPDAGQSVDHLHLHVLGGRRMSWPPG